MSNQYHFISGLPRSGSTLLSTILNQNPRFRASVTSPVGRLCGTTHDIITSPEFGVLFDEEKRASMLRGVFDNYYADHQQKVVFDTNRTWTGRISLLMRLFPESRMICCVRDIGWIIDSLERLMAKHPLDSAAMFRHQPGATLYARVETVMHAATGFIGLPWTQLREAWYGPHADRLIVITYDQLVKNPKQTIKKLYVALGEPEFAHDFDNVANEYPEYDLSIGVPEMHKIRQKVTFEDRQTILPPDIFTKYQSTQFWAQPDDRSKKVLIL